MKTKDGVGLKFILMALGIYFRVIFIRLLKQTLNNCWIRSIIENSFKKNF